VGEIIIRGWATGAGTFWLKNIWQD
jgi:hypothetical protein